MAYPATIITFTDPSGTSLLASGPDHAALHTSINDTVEALETTLGTTAGTNIAKNFNPGDFPARINTSNVLQQVLTGTVNLSAGTITGQLVNSGTIGGGAYGTALHIGGTANNIVLGTPTLTLGSDAQGDVYYRSSGGTVTRLAPGTTGQFLRTQGASANPAWANVTNSIVATRGTAVLEGTATSYEDIAGLIGTITTKPNTTLMIHSKIGGLRHSATNGQTSFIVNIDTVDEGAESILFAESPIGGAAGITLSGAHLKTGLTGGTTHVVKLRWKINSGTASIGNGFAGSELILMEI